MEKLEFQMEDLPSLEAGLFKVSGAVDVFSYKEFKATLDQWYKDSPRKNLLVDMTAVSYVGSSGWSVVFLQSSIHEQAGGMVVLFGMAERVERSLNIIMPRKRHLNVAPDFEGAKALLAQAPTQAAH
jgi:anti-anti-sigma factor